MSTYATTQELVQFLNIEGTVPSREAIGSDRPDETVGTGDNSTTKFYLDKAYVIADTYSFRYSAAEGTTGTALTETTHYTLDKDDGTLTLTATGVTTVTTNNIYGQYSYSKFGLTDSILQDKLDYAEAEINKRTTTVFVDGTATTPAWIQKTNEDHTGKGGNDRTYFLNRYPIPDVSTTVSGTAITADDTSVFVVDTQGFPSSGFISIEDDKIQYTSKTGSAFTGCTSVAAHGTAETVKPYVIEISTTTSGNTPEWTVLEENQGYHLDITTGRISLQNADLSSTAANTVAFSRFPAYQIANRLRASYITGVDSIKDEIKRCCLMVAAKEIKHMTVNTKTMEGMDEFNPELIDVDEKWIDKTINGYKKLKMDLI